MGLSSLYHLLSLLWSILLSTEEKHHLARDMTFTLSFSPKVVSTHRKENIQIVYRYQTMWLMKYMPETTFLSVKDRTTRIIMNIKLRIFYSFQIKMKEPQIFCQNLPKKNVSRIIQFYTLNSNRVSKMINSLSKL